MPNTLTSPTDRLNCLTENTFKVSVRSEILQQVIRLLERKTIKMMTLPGSWQFEIQAIETFRQFGIMTELKCFEYNKQVYDKMKVIPSLLEMSGFKNIEFLRDDMTKYFSEGFWEEELDCDVVWMDLCCTPVKNNFELLRDIIPGMIYRACNRNKRTVLYWTFTLRPQMKPKNWVARMMGIDKDFPNDVDMYENVNERIFDYIFETLIEDSDVLASNHVLPIYNVIYPGGSTSMPTITQGVVVEPMSNCDCVPYEKLVELGLIKGTDDFEDLDLANGIIEENSKTSSAKDTVSLLECLSIYGFEDACWFENRLTNPPTEITNKVYEEIESAYEVLSNT